MNVNAPGSVSAPDGGISAPTRAQRPEVFHRMKESFPAQCEAAPATQSFFQTGMRRLRTAIQQISKLGQALKGKVSRNALAFSSSFEISAASLIA